MKEIKFLIPIDGKYFEMKENEVDTKVKGSFKSKDTAKNREYHVP